jgi:hypothetical protein
MSMSAERCLVQQQGPVGKLAGEQAGRQPHSAALEQMAEKLKQGEREDGIN